MVGGDQLDHAWSALIHYGADPSEYNDSGPEQFEEDDYPQQEVDELYEDFDEEEEQS